MKSLLHLVVFCAFSFNLLNAQTKNWAWVKGDSSINKYGIYGIKGSNSPANKPGARNRSNNWTDASGNLWMFGGSGSATRNSGYLNDLWKYNPSTNEWIWINGDSLVNKKSTYGTIGVVSQGNKPGARKNSITWTDNANNLWLFGGYGYSSSSTVGILNDLWKYNISTNQWTWVKGDTITNAAGLYGTKGTSSPNKKPGARHLSVGWADTQGNLWLFGGFGYDETGASGDLSDLWKFDIATNKWTWVKGDNIINVKGKYGVRSIPAISNNPGARAAPISWSDGAGNFYLFGGYGYDALTPGYLSDLWKYNINSNTWTWINGDNIINVRPNYGFRGVPSSTNNPGARVFSIAGTGADGKIWLFGGFGYPGNGFGYLNDLWKYDTDLNEWTWIKGNTNDNMPGYYGQLGSASNSSTPGSRQQGVAWVDLLGTFWLFGGQGYTASTFGYLNDLWKYGSENSLPVHLLSFTGKKTNETNELTWAVENEINFDRYEIEKSINGKDFQKTGAIKAIKAKVYHYVDYALNVSQTQYYRLKMIDKDGKSTLSNVVTLTTKTSNSLSIYPNPAVDKFYLNVAKPITGKATVEIIDACGKILTRKIIGANNLNIPMTTNNLPPGTYQIRLVNNDEIFIQPLVIIK